MTVIEPGPKLATILSARVPEATVIVSTLEAADLPPHAFDTVVAATAMHWVDLDVGLSALHRALRPVVISRCGATSSAPKVRLRPSGSVWPTSWPPAPLIDPGTRKSPRIARAWGSSSPRATSPPVETLTWDWSIELSSAQVARLFATFSDWTTEEVTAAARAADDCGGAVLEQYSTRLHLLVRRSSTTAA